MCALKLISQACTYELVALLAERRSQRGRQHLLGLEVACAGFGCSTDICLVPGLLCWAAQVLQISHLLITFLLRVCAAVPSGHRECQWKV